jgi:hypothetical protein
MVYNAIFEDSKIFDELYKFVKKACHPVHPVCFELMAFRSAVLGLLKVAVVGAEVATELVEAGYKKIFAKRSARAGLCETQILFGYNLGELMTVDAFGVGVTPLRFLQRIELVWDVRRISRRKDDLQYPQRQLEALQLLVPRPGLQVSIQIFVGPGTSSWLEELLESCRPTYEFLTKSRIEFSLGVKYPYQEWEEVTSYYTKPLGEWREEFFPIRRLVRELGGLVRMLVSILVLY